MVNKDEAFLIFESHNLCVYQRFVSSIGIIEKAIWIFNCLGSTVEYGQLITKKYLGEHKVITAEQQFLGLILWFFMYLKWPWLLRLFAVLL